MSWKKKSKSIVLAMALFLVSALAAMKYIYKPSAENFIKEVAADQTKWQGAIIEIQGIVSSSNTKGAILNKTIYCQYKDEYNSYKIKNGYAIKFKGRFIGYDDLLEEIKLDKCILIK